MPALNMLKALSLPLATHFCAKVEVVLQGRALWVQTFSSREKINIALHAEELSCLEVGDTVLVLATEKGYVLTHKLVSLKHPPRAGFLQQQDTVELKSKSIILQASEEMILLAPDLKLN